MFQRCFTALLRATRILATRHTWPTTQSGTWPMPKKAAVTVCGRATAQPQAQILEQATGNRESSVAAMASSATHAACQAPAARRAHLGNSHPGPCGESNSSVTQSCSPRQGLPDPLRRRTGRNWARPSCSPARAKGLRPTVARHVGCQGRSKISWGKPRR